MCVCVEGMENTTQSGMIDNLGNAALVVGGRLFGSQTGNLPNTYPSLSMPDF